MKQKIFTPALLAHADGQGIHVAVPDDEGDEGYERKIGGRPQRTSRRTEMIAERHNAPQHNLHANQAGNAGDCASSTHSSQPWRRLGRFFAITMLASFVLNEIWEMAQMSAYVETAQRS